MNSAGNMAVLDGRWANLIEIVESGKQILGAARAPGWEHVTTGPGDR